MKATRRRFVRTAGTGALAAALAPRLARAQGPSVAAAPFDVAVIGAGVFGSWTAYHLQRAGRRVALIDGYGPANARSSSGGFTRVIRMAYGDKEIYTRWSMRSLELWKELLRRSARTQQFQESGVLWMAREKDPLTMASAETLARLGVKHERLERAELARRWPQIDFGPITWAIHEPDSGFLAAFHVVQAVVQLAVSDGLAYMQESVLAPKGKGELAALSTASGRTIAARTFVLACGPWLPKLLPDLLGDRIFPTRQEVFYIGVPAGDLRFQSPAMPVWADFSEEIYGVPDFRGRGFKVALDKHGDAVDPDTLERVPSKEAMDRVLEFVGRRFPALKGAPVVGAEVCQYENTFNGDFLIDRHPELANVWLVGGGSGHGFKHGPAIGEYVAARIADGQPVDARFSLAAKQKIQQRTVF
jgi:monomeric sarcosine oxidase